MSTKERNFNSLMFSPDFSFPFLLPVKGFPPHSVYIYTQSQTKNCANRLGNKWSAFPST